MSENNPFPNENNTGHFWDDTLRELSNDPPGWWTIGLHASWIWCLVYFFLYPSIPSLDLEGYSKGSLGWTAVSEYKADLAAIDEVRQKWEDKINDPKTSAAMILADDDLKNYTVRSAKVLFGDYCAACHGSGGSGNGAMSAAQSGYPVLADDDWLYGGTVEQIETTIYNGRKGIMPNYGARLSETEIADLAKHVVALSEGGEHAVGKELFINPTKGGCFACHGMAAKGMAALGSANLTDAVWRFEVSGGGDHRHASALHTIAHGVNSELIDPASRNAVMPAFGPLGKDLSAGSVKKLAVYVHQLGGGQ
jgi:cytochrome c oxidase cbb3-type subunit 3